MKVGIICSNQLIGRETLHPKKNVLHHASMKPVIGRILAYKKMNSYINGVARRTKPSRPAFKLS